MMGDEAASGDGRLERLRAELDAIDDRIVEALADRLRVVGVIAAFKKTQPEALRDRPREQALLDRVDGLARALRIDPHFVVRLFREIIDHSVRRQQAHLLDREPGRDPQSVTVVGYQGTEGAWGHLAAQRHFGARANEVDYRAFETFADMVDAVRGGLVHVAMLPIENTTAGSINEAYDLLGQLDVAIVGEEIQPVDHCLMAVEAVQLSKIRRILSHPQAIAQCSNFLQGLPHCHVEAFANTALAARKVREDQDLSQGAIGSEEAARIWGLHVIARHITNQRENYTRFVVVGPHPLPCDTRIACKTSLIFVTRHEQGALVSCLNVFARHGLNLTKLESRPKQGSPWEYVFYVDFEGNLQDAATSAALQEVAAHVLSLKVLGCYPARRLRPAAATGTQG
jgi:chorismate mutase/prephenate dehydratase